MYNTSTEYKTEIKNASRSFECRVTIGDVILSNDDIVDIALDENIQSSDTFSIGNVTSQVLDLTILNKGQTIFTTNQIKVEIGLKIGATTEYILMGYYNIDDVVKTDYIIKYTCYDNMIKFETPYFSGLGDTPILTEVVNELATITGVQFIGSLPAYTVKKLEGFTCREILGYVASVCGGNAVITRDGKFNIVYPVDSGIAITGHNYFDYKREEVNYKIGKISCQNNEKSIISQGLTSIDSMELLFENPWVTNAILANIYGKLNGFEYLGYAMKWQGDLSLDPGDILTVTDIKGVVRKLPILSQKFTYTGGLTAEIGAKGESKNKNSFSSSGSMGKKVDRVVYEQALINEAFINKANITDLTAANIKVGILEGGTANLQTILTSFISGTAGQYLKLTGQNVVFEEAIIKDAMIDTLSVDKLLTGDISTNKIRLVSDSGQMLISDNTIQISDTNRTRVQIGKDASDDYNMYVWDINGNLMFDAMGLKADGIKTKIIRDDMVKDDANIDGKKINIASLITSINNDGTSTIKGSKILLDDEAQTLGVAFSSLKSNVDNIQIGGRNLLSDSDFEKGILTPVTINLGVNTLTAEAKYSGLLGWKCVTSALYNASGGNVVCPNLVIGTQYTASIKIKCPTNDAVTFMVWKGSNWTSSGIKVSNLVAGEWTTLSIVFTATETSHKIGVLNGSLKSITYYMDNVKVEIGNKATDWTPSPEDIDSKISAATTAIGLEQGRINTLIDNTTLLDNGVTIQLKDAYSTLEQTVDGISTKVANIQTDMIKITNKPIVFNNLVGGTMSVNTFTKDTGLVVGWGNSGFGSSTTFINSESVSFTVVNLSTVVMFGLSLTNPDTAYGTIKYAWYQEGVNLRIYESGTPKNSYITAVVGDVLKISIANNLVYYYRNDILIYTSLSAYTTPLILDVAMHTGAVTATGSISVTGVASRVTSAESAIIQHTTEITNRVTSTEFTNVMSNFNLVCNFNNVVNGVFASNTFTKKTGVTNTWDAGFSATNPLYNGDYVEFTVTNLSTNIMLGLANSTTGNGFSNINFAIYQALSGIQVYESNVPKGTKGGTLAVGHKLRVAIEDNKINYYQNGTLIYTSLTVPVLPLYLDCSVYQIDAVVSNITRGTLYAGLITRMSSAETSLTDSAFTIQISKNQNRIYKVRYIRDWIGANDGTGSPYSPRWQEIEAINNHGVNVALGKTCTAQPGYTFFNGSTQVTNGNPFDNEGCSYNQTMTNCYIVLDLGSPISNLDLLRVFHAPYNDFTPATFYNTKTEVSEDGTNWLTVFDSAISGKYKEITSGHVIALNNHFSHTMKGSFTDEGLTVDAGAMKIVDGTDEVILMSKDGINNCGIEIGSRTHTNTPYLDFHSSGFANDNDSRIISVGGTNLAGGGTGYNGTAQLNFHAGSFNFNNIVNCSNIVNSVSGQLIASSAGSVYQINHVGAENYMQIGVAGGYKGIYYNVSDAKLKYNITDNTGDSLSKILQFKHHSFDWKDGHGHVNMGWIAQELQEIDKEFVFGVEQEDNTEILQPIHNTILPHITRSIQQLHEENLLLKTTISDLTKRIEIIERGVG